MKEMTFSQSKKTNPKQSQFQTRSEAEIPTGELLGILKPGTNFKGKKCCVVFLLTPTKPAQKMVVLVERPAAIGYKKGKVKIRCSLNKIRNY